MEDRYSVNDNANEVNKRIIEESELPGWRRYDDEDPINLGMSGYIKTVKEEGNTEGPYGIQVHVVEMSPDEVLENLYDTRPKSVLGMKISGMEELGFGDWKEGAHEESEYMDKLKEALQSNEHKVPLITFFSHSHGPNELSEGRHRALAAKELGAKKIPVVWINKNYA